MATPSHPPAPVPIFLSGSKPGVFDPTQPARLLRYPDSTLHFALLNPSAGSSLSLSADALARASRIVVEVPMTNGFVARPNWFSFVPSAILAPGVASEGKWPRVVDYCRQRVVCDQDQWDLHKLDPMYECFVPATAEHPIISKKISLQGGTNVYPTSAASSTFNEDLASGASCKFVFFTPTAATASSPTPPAGPAGFRTPQPGHEQSATEDAVALLALRPADPLLELERLRRRQAQYQEWMPWTPHRALERYLAVSEQFDSARFSYENPVDPFFIPWPILQSPFALKVNQVDWEMVQAFFDEARRQMKTEDYRAFVTKSQKRFHLDRCLLRGVFKTHDSDLGQALERAFVRVSQVINSIRDEFRAV